MRHRFLSGHYGGLCGVSLSAALSLRFGESWLLPATGTCGEAATKAIATCAGNGYPVSAVVVDPSGVIKLEARATTRPSSPAHVSLPQGIHGRDFQADLSVRCFEHVCRSRSQKSDRCSACDAAQHRAAPGGVAIKVKDEVVAALGVGGSPGGDKDEACAQAGVASIKDDLASSRELPWKYEGDEHE